VDACDLTLHEALDAVRAKRVSAREVVESCLQRADRLNQKLNVFITRTADSARAVAESADTRRSNGEDPGPLGGLPIGLKDIFLTRGVLTTCASHILDGFIPPYDATTVERLRTAGAAFVGKLNLDEFAMGSSNENSYYGPVHNPWNNDYVPGGSSGGSAAAVAAGMCLGALGTDTGGSIRQPAAFCGLTGVKPTYGRVSRFGIIAFASSLDQVGPIAHDVRDCALLLGILAGHDPRDATSAALPVPDYLAQLEDGVRGMRLGMPEQYFGTGLDPEIERLVRAAIAEYEQLGAQVVPVSLPSTEYAVAAYYIVAPAEASANLARYDGVRYGLRVGEDGGLLSMYQTTRKNGFGREVKRRIMLGTYVLSAGYYEAYYRKAMQVRTLIRREFEQVFKKVDALLCPTSPIPPFRLGEKSADPLAMYLADVYTVPCNLAGLPGLSLPCGFTSNGLPVGLQLLGKPFDEATLLRVARAYEREHDWCLRRPR
jgi:aspartyl-tRNA(Asn)/glutamyl-tRNA(Gln) amidotransferase subunit A